MKPSFGRLRFSGPAALILLLGTGIPWNASDLRRTEDFDTMGTLPRGASRPPSPKRSDRIPVSILQRSDARAGDPSTGRSRPDGGDRALPIPSAARPPIPADRLSLCAEYTKPDSLRIRLLGTPQNHRSPPA